MPSARPQTTPITYVIFENTFRNDTARIQKHRIRCVWHKESHTQVNLHHTIVCEERIRLQLSELPELITHKSSSEEDGKGRSTCE